MLPVHLERENEGMSWYETYWEQNTLEAHLSLSAERRVRHELCFSRILPLHLRSFTSCPECKTSHREQFAILLIYKMNFIFAGYASGKIQY